MPILSSVSGVRGTIGGPIGTNLTAIDIVRYVSAYAMWIKQNGNSGPVVIGRDGRLSGEWILKLTASTLQSMGIDVVDVDYSTTPTVEMYVLSIAAPGGIILTASHNPRHWNALKMLNARGEFLGAEDNAVIQEIMTQNSYDFATVDELGTYSRHDEAMSSHIDAILNLSSIDAGLIAQKKYHILIDCINSTADISIPPLLEALGCTYELINEGQYGEFSHDPEPLEKNLKETLAFARKGSYDLTVVVDPDVDRLLLIDEKGQMVGEEYTLVIVANYLLSRKKGTVVNNLSSSRALYDVAKRYDVECYSSKVGEAHVVAMMKDKEAVLGGEGNGGIILPELHYGRDALVGIALVLTAMASSEKSISELRSVHADYFMSKQKVQLASRDAINTIFDIIVQDHLKLGTVDLQDGVKISWDDCWVQIRPSNTEPVLRVYAEALSIEKAENIANEYISIISDITATHL